MSTLSVSAGIRLGRFHLEVEHAFALQGITVLFGPSGSGKSTLLRIVAGLEQRAAGCVTFQGETWQSERSFVPAHRRGVGLVFQETRLFPHLTVAGNLAYADRRAPATPGSIDRAGVVRALDLMPLLSRHPSSLSGGERRRVAIARTLLTRPRLLLMDEPLAALDLKRKAAILPYIEQLPAAFGVPIIYVTHAVEEVARLADEMVVLAHGRTVASGPVQDVLERLDLPDMTGRFEAGVILTARVLRHDPKYRLTRLDHHGQTIVMPAVDVAEGSVQRLRVRARDVALATRRPEAISVRNVLSGVVREIAQEPASAFAEVLVDIGGARLRSRITREALDELGLVPGASVFALVKSIAFDRRALASRSAPVPEQLCALASTSERVQNGGV